MRAVDFLRLFCMPFECSEHVINGVSVPLRSIDLHAQLLSFSCYRPVSQYELTGTALCTWIATNGYVGAPLDEDSAGGRLKALLRLLQNDEQLGKEPLCRAQEGHVPPINSPGACVLAACWTTFPVL